MGEPHAHKTIELQALEVTDPHLAKDLDTKFRSLPEPQRFALETYSGNWMRDFSQVFVPIVMDKCKCIKKEIGFSKPWTSKPDKTTIGAAGAEELVTALLKVVATIELGETIGTDIVTPENLGPYKTEDHMDNPAGLRLEELVIRVGKEYVTASDESPDVVAARQKQIGSSAFKGKLTLEEPTLYEVGPSGLANHIYGTIEWVKQTFKDAVSKDPRMNRVTFGKGLHGVEDYFGHSNFIEVALNSLREQIVVDTLFEKYPNPPKKQQSSLTRSRCYLGDLFRQPITTGTFGTLDTYISIAHSVLPLIDLYYDYLDKAIDIFLGIIEENDASTWDKLKELGSKHRSAIALALLLEGMDKAGIKLPVLHVETIQLNIPGILLPDEIQKEIQGVEFPIDIDTEYVPPTKAVVEYKRYYEVIKKAMPLLKKLKEEITEAILDALPAKVREMIETYENLKDAYEKFRKWLKNEIRMIIIRLIEGVLGISVEDFAAKKHKKLEEIAEDTRALAMEIMEYVTHWEAQTALEVRIESGDLKKKKIGQTTYDKVVPKHEKGSELPPSHSEVCKDHPPESHRSLFYELHLELATKADKHLFVLMHRVWSETCPETWIIRNPSSILDEAELERLDQEASKVAEREKERAKKANRTFAQNDPNLSLSMKKLLNAVDLYVSHPEESDWWLDIVKNFQFKLEEDIRGRNETRGHRQLQKKTEVPQAT
ncbi:MAG: HET-C-related protein [Candidatus Bathyarchaeia archaeon]|jgi:hypothetical protein